MKLLEKSTIVLFKTHSNFLHNSVNFQSVFIALDIKFPKTKEEDTKNMSFAWYFQQKLKKKNLHAHRNVKKGEKQRSGDKGFTASCFAYD